MDDGSTPQVGDRGLSTQEAADILVQRRQERASEPEKPAPTQEDGAGDEPVAEDKDLDTPEGGDAEDDPGRDSGEDDDDQGDDPVIEDEAGDPDDEGQEPDDDPDADEDDGGAEDTFKTVDELAEAAGMELDDFLQLELTTTVDGVEGTVTLEQLRKGYQLESSFTRKNQEWIKQKQAAEAEIQTTREKLNDHFALTTEVFQHAQQAIVADFESINWQQLQASDPEEHQRLRQQFGMRQGRLNQAMQESTAKLQKAAEAQEADEVAAEKQTMIKEHELLMSKVPAWSDSKVRDAEAAEIGKYLTSVGYQAAELEKMTDHRLILLARAALGQAGPSKKKLDLAKKKLSKVPKIAKPGSRNKPRNSGDGKRIEGLQKNLKKSGSTDDAAELLIARQNARRRQQRRGRSPA